MTKRTPVWLVLAAADMATQASVAREDKIDERAREVTLISLQTGPGAEQLKRSDGHFRVVDLGDGLSRADDVFAETAAVMMNLDLVITVDTPLAHLAGALGVPVWVALQLAPNWRWLVARDDSPWYPTMRLFRQSRLGAWNEVFARMAGELESFSARSRVR